MSNLISLNKINSLKKLYAEDDGAARMLDHMATALNHRKVTSVDYVTQQLGIGRSKAIQILQLLSETGCGTFRKGRETKNVQNPTRIEWIDHYAQIGKAARGELSEFGEAIVSEHDETKSGIVPFARPNPALPTALLTIREAKRLLAEALGVDESNIEITIKG